MNTAKKKAKAWAKVEREAIKAQKRINYAKDRLHGGRLQRNGAQLQEIIYYQTLRYERLKAKANALG
jgi:hypothetical protein